MKIRQFQMRRFLSILMLSILISGISFAQNIITIPALDPGDSICIVYDVEVNTPFPIGVGQVQCQDTIMVTSPMAEVPTSDPDSLPTMFAPTGTLICNPLAGTLSGSDMTICAGSSVMFMLSGNQTAPEYTQVFLVVDAGTNAVVDIQTDLDVEFNTMGSYHVYSYNYLTGSTSPTMPANISDIDCSAMGSCCDLFMGSFTITVSEVTPGVISMDQVICSGDTPAPITGTAASGPGTISYQWQQSTTGCMGTFSDIGGATAQDYSPGALTTTTNYRRIDISTNGGVMCMDTTNCVTITVNDVTASSIGPDIYTCPDVLPGSVAETGSSSGSGMVTRQWQFSYSGGCEGTFVDIMGANGNSVGIPALTTNDTLGVRLIVTSTLGGSICMDTSNCVLVIANRVDPGVIGTDATICSGEDPAALTEITPATGTGTLSYRWQMSTAGCMGMFSDIGGATSSTYDPPALTMSTSYRRITTSTLMGVMCEDTSNCVTITVNDITAGVISGEDTICAGTMASTIMETSPAGGSGALSYQWQESTTGCAGTFADIMGANMTTYDPGSLSQTTSYRRIDISTLNMVECRDTTNCITKYVQSITIDSIVQVCLDPMSYDLKVCFQVETPGPSGMFTVDVGALNFGPYNYTDLDPDGCITISNMSFDPTDLETFDVTVSDVDEMCTANQMFTETLCFTCPVIGGLSAPSQLCEEGTFDLSATGLMNMGMAMNSETDFGISFVAFSGGPPADPYTGGVALGTVPFASLTSGGTVATLSGIDPGLVGPPGTYTLCAILDPAPTLDMTCRPSLSVTLDLFASAPLNCRDINVSIDPFGDARFALSDLIMGASCSELLNVMISTSGGQIIHQDFDLSRSDMILLSDVCPYSGQELIIMLTYASSGLSCQSRLSFGPANGPAFMPGRVANVWCTDSLVSGGDIDDMAPEAYIPCFGPVESHFVADWVVPYDCEEDQDTAKVIYREYEAFDKEGKRASVFDTIVVFRLPQIHNESIFCSESTTLYCGDTSGWQGPTAFFAKGGILPVLSLDLIDVGYDENGDLDFSAIELDPKCGLQVHVDYLKFTEDPCEQQYKVTIELKQSCSGGLNEIALTPGATDMVGGPPIPPNVWVPLTADYTYWKCEFWVTDLDTLAPVAICKGEPFFDGPIAEDKWTFNTIRDFDFLDTNFLGGLVGDIPSFDDIMIPDFLTMLDTSKAPSSLKFASEQILMDPDLYLGLNLGFVEATEATEFTFDWDLALGAFDGDNTIFDDPGAIGLIGYGINGTFYKLVEGIEEPLLDEFEPYQDFLDGIMGELEVDAELCNLNISLLLEDSWGETTIRLEEGDVFTLFGIWVSNSDASITFSGENLIATNTHDCAAHTYVPPLYVQEDWSGIKLVKATIDGIGTVVMDYDAEQGCYVSHQLLKLPHRATPYVVEYEVFDSCHNVGYELCYLKVKDRTDPVAVADKGVTVSLTDKKVWVEANTFDEGSEDNCGVNWILARRADWSTACVNLCYNHADTLEEGLEYASARFPIWTDGHDTLWCLDLESDKAWDAVEAHYAKQLEWWCIDGADCGEIIYNSWIYDLIKEATLACTAHSYLDDQGFYDLLYKALQHPNADPNGHLNGLLESKFKCEVSKANAECVLPFSFGRFPLLEFLISGPPIPLTIPIPVLSPLTSSVKMMYLTPETGICGYNDATIKANLDTWSQIGGGWSDAVPFSCEDACGPVTVEILVMDYWCNWSTAWTTVWVEDKTPIEVAKDVVEEIEITCATYKADQYYYPGEIHAMGLDDLVALGKEGDSLALSVLDTILGGYCKAWKDPYGNYVDIDGNEIDCDIHFTDAYCHCEPIDTQIRVYDDHFGYIWKDSTYTKCYYETEDVLLQKGVVVVNCAENVYCEQELWCEFDHCGQGYIFRKWKIWSSCEYSSEDGASHIPDTTYRHQRIWVGNECELSKYMFDVPGDTTITSCALEYDPAGSGQLVGDLDPDITGYPVYKFDDDCRIIGIGHQDKVFKVVGGDAACYKVVRTWYFADWCGGKPVDNYWWYDRGLIIDSCVQKIIVQDTVGPVCTITGPVNSGDTIEVGGCDYNFAASVSTTDACGVISYSWVLKQIEEGIATEIDSDLGALSSDTTAAFDISSDGLLPGTYKLVVTTVDECQNEGVCEYDFTLLSAKKPTPICITFLSATLTPWDTDGDGVIDSAHAVIWASEFNSSSALACEDDSLAYRIEFLDGIDDDTYLEDSASLDLSCANIGTKLVRLWVLSYPSGTADYCDVILMVNSNGEGCDVSSSHTPSGKDMAETGEQGETPDHTGVGSDQPDIAGDAPQVGGSSLVTGDYKLEQNRPNPFREETVIEFSLPEAMEATITIYDVTGRQLRQIQGDFTRGYNQVQFRKEGLQASGILFYQLRTAEYTEVKRMMLVR